MMQASTATDASSPPVQYFFDYVSGSGGHDSAWQTSQDYTDTGLTPNSFYNYRCKARDSATPNPNETSYSMTILAGTAIETPTGVSFGATDNTSIVVNADGTFSLTQSEKVHGTRPAAENLFESAAKSLKERITGAQARAILAVNREMVLLYWQLGQYYDPDSSLGDKEKKDRTSTRR
jgi:hypothetical protein